MIGVQNQGDVESALHYFVGTLLGQRVQEIGSVAQFRIALNDRLLVPQPVKRCDKRACLRHEARGLTYVRFRRSVLGLGVVQRKHGNGCAQDVHWSLVACEPQEIDHCAGNRPLSNQLLF